MKTIDMTDRQIEAARYLANWATPAHIARIARLYEVSQHELIALFAPNAKPAKEDDTWTQLHP